ncbi:MAG: CotH kinase family protein [Ruminococcus sp.]|uniref:CotH kinase family protein n=1 Tax=Ruminococcus sp. TaxID=41978 RepID=UPI0025E37D9C|nr:CotH kinase family protein [Ruminococcus sp.]MCR5599873.1 CotH kinase family protein [Ruminococcus sp.]
MEQAAQYIDILSLVDNYIANEICKNVDSDWDSYYISKDAGGKLTFNPMWDYDLALGNFIDVKGYDSAAGLGVYNVPNCNANSNQ